MSDPILDKLDAKLKPRIDALQASEKNVFDNQFDTIRKTYAHLQSRLTIAERRVRELALMLQLHWIEGECFCLSRNEGGTGGVCTHCATGQLLKTKDGWSGDVTNLRAELDKLKGME